MKKKPDAEPSRASLGALPEVDFRRYGPGRRNPFAKRLHREGWQLWHEGPAAGSVSEMPEVAADAVGRPNPYARRIAAGGIELQVGRGPRAGHETGPTEVRSVRLPPAIWKALEQRARAEGLSLHALVRTALLEWLDR
jgi:hypothetical protein